MSSSGRFPAIWCIGRNYADHAAELGNERPERPMVFMKNPASVIGDGESIVIPEVCRFPRPQVDWEAELGVVVGRDVRDLGVGEGMGGVEGGVQDQASMLAAASAAVEASGWVGGDTRDPGIVPDPASSSS